MPVTAKKHSTTYSRDTGFTNRQLNTGLSKNKTLNAFNYILCLTFLISLIFSLRAVSSISLGAILLTGIITNRSALQFFFQKNNRTLFLAACILLFLLQVIAILYTNNTQQGWTDVRIKTGLLVTPLAVCLSVFMHTEIQKKLIHHYCLLLAVAAFYCLCISFTEYVQSNDFSHFFYHALVSPIAQHAIYFSVLIMIGLIFLFENFRKREFVYTKAVHICLLLFLSIFLLLLSSKFVIAFFLFYLLYSLLFFSLKKQREPYCTDRFTGSQLYSYQLRSRYPKPC